MDHLEGAGLQRADRVDFDPRVRLEFLGTQLSSPESQRRFDRSRAPSATCPQ